MKNKKRDKTKQDKTRPCTNATSSSGVIACWPRKTRTECSASRDCRPKTAITRTKRQSQDKHNRKWWQRTNDDKRLKVIIRLKLRPWLRLRLRQRLENLQVLQEIGVLPSYGLFQINTWYLRQNKASQAQGNFTTISKKSFKARQDKTRQDEIRRNTSTEHRTRQRKTTMQHNTRRNKTRQHKKRHNKIRRDETRQERDDTM